MWTTLLLFRWRMWGCPTSKHCVWIVFEPLARWGGACPKHSSSIVVVQVTRVGLSNLQTLRLNSFCASSTMEWRVPQTLLEHSIDDRFFFFSLSPPWIFHQFLQKSRPTPIIYFSFISSPCHFNYYFFILNCPWHYIFFFNFTLYHFLNYKQFITLQMFFQFHSLWFLLLQIQLSFS